MPDPGKIASPSQSSLDSSLRAFFSLSRSDSGSTKAIRSRFRAVYAFPTSTILHCICGSRISPLSQRARTSWRGRPLLRSSSQQVGSPIEFASRLFGPRPALIALFALNVTPFFFASAGSWIVPDGPLLFGLAVAALAATRLFFPEPLEEVQAWRLWLLIGVALGLAGLSKYSAVLTAGGLAAFVLLSPRQRHWLRHPAPYVAAGVAFVMITPVIVWNARHGWASFEFQGGRGAPSGALRPAQLLTMALGEVAFLTPWIFAPLVAGMMSAFEHWRDDRRLFILCLSLPPIVLFTLTPLWGGRGQPHWAMPGWFFAFPLLGVWVEELGVSVRSLRRWAFFSSAALAAIAGVALLQASTGWPWVALGGTAQSCRSHAGGL